MAAATPTAGINSNCISFLPQQVLHQIFTSLETKDVTRTSVLPNRFYFTSHSFPILDHHNDLSHDNSNIRVDRPNRRIELLFYIPFDSVFHTFGHHQGLKISLQRLRVPVSKAEQHLDRVRELINFALTKKVTDLDVDLQGFTDEYLLTLIEPPSDGHFESVGTLRLSNLKLNASEDMIRVTGLKDWVRQKCSKFAHLKKPSSHIRSIKLMKCPKLSRSRSNLRPCGRSNRRSS